MCGVFNDKVCTADGNGYFAGDYNSEILIDCRGIVYCVFASQLFLEFERSRADFPIFQENPVPKR